MNYTKTKKEGPCKTKTCSKRTLWLFTRQKCKNGALKFFWQCSVCKCGNPDRSPRYYIPAELVRQHLTEEQIAALPVVLPEMDTRCVVCGSRWTELHHWAPTEIFGEKEVDKWPKDYLCVECHQQWHRMVTPQHVPK